MKQTINLIILLFSFPVIINAQEVLTSDTGPGEGKLQVTGEMSTDERFLLSDDNAWSWHESRLALNMDKKLSGSSKFHSQVWLRNIGLPEIYQSSDLYNKGITDPFDIEIRELCVELYGFLSKNLDVSIGRQFISWGTADKLNPSDILNPYDMEDILDFGRQRGTDALNAVYYIANNISLQGVFIPFFRPANMPTGLFANALTPSMTLPEGMTLMEVSDTIMMPGYTLKNSSFGFRFKGTLKGVDFSLGYTRSFDGMPVTVTNTFTPADAYGGVKIRSELSFIRTHTICADWVTSIAGAGLWGEAALFITDGKVNMATDLSALYPSSPDPVIQDSTIIDKPYTRFIIGGDYIFNNGSYLNIQYMHGFFHEKGNRNMNDYLFLRYEMKFLNDKLTLAPLSGAVIVSDRKDVKNNCTVAYLPQIAYEATPDIKFTLSLALFDGKGNSLFSAMNDYDMFIFNLKYSF